MVAIHWGELKGNFIVADEAFEGGRVFIVTFLEQGLVAMGSEVIK